MNRTEEKDKNVKKGLLKRAYDWTRGVVVRRFRKEKEAQAQETNGSTQGATEIKELAQQKETNGSQSDEEYGIKFTKCFLNDIERGSRGLADIVFSDEFMDAVKNMEVYTPFELQLCGPQKQYLLKKLIGQKILGGDYQDEDVVKDMEKYREELVKKLNKGREGIRELDKRDVDVVLATLANREGWLERLYDEVLNFGIKTNNENPAEAIGSALSYLTNTPTLIPKAECQGALIQKEKIVRIMDKKIDEKGIKEAAKHYIKLMIETQDADLTKDDALKDKIAKELVPLIGGILVEDDGGKKTELEKRLLLSIEALNSATQNKKMTTKELEDNFRTYEILNRIENALEEALLSNQTEATINKAKEKIEEAVGIWGGGLKESIRERISIVENRAYVLWIRYCDKNGVRKLAEGVKATDKAIEELNTSASSQTNREILQRMIKIAMIEIRTLKRQLYPPINVIDEIRNGLGKKDEGFLSRLDLLKARTKIRDVPIDLGQLKDGLPAEEQKWYKRWAIKIRKTAYNWLQWLGVMTAFKITRALLVLAANIMAGASAIRRNWHLRYPHAMYSVEIKGRKTGLSRRTGVIINMLLTRAIGGWLALCLFAGSWPFRDTRVEDFAISVWAQPKYVKVRTETKKGEDNILNVVWIDDHNATRKIRKSDIQERYGIQKEENIEFLMNEPEVLVYLDGLVSGERKMDSTTKKIGYRLNKEKADDLVDEIKKKKDGMKPEDCKQKKERAWLILPAERPIMPLDKIEMNQVLFLDKEYIYPAKIDEYKKKYSLGVEDAKKLSELAAQNTSLFNLLTRGADDWYIKDAKEFLKAHGNSIYPETRILVLPQQGGQQTAATAEDNVIVIPENAGYIEPSISTNKEIGIPYIELNEKNLNYLVKMKKEGKTEVIRAILEMVKINNYINKEKESELISVLEDEITNVQIPLEKIAQQEKAEGRSTQTRYVKGDLYERFVEQLKNNDIIRPKETSNNEEVSAGGGRGRAPMSSGTTAIPKTPAGNITQTNVGIKTTARPTTPAPQNNAAKPAGQKRQAKTPQSQPKAPDIKKPNAQKQAPEDKNKKQENKGKKEDPKPPENNEDDEGAF